MGTVVANGAEIRGGACGFPTVGYKVKVKEADERLVAEGGDKKITSGSGDTTAQDLLGQETGNSGGVVGPTSHFRRMCEVNGI